MESGCVQRPNVVTQFFVCFQCVCVRENWVVCIWERGRNVCVCAREREREREEKSVTEIERGVCHGVSERDRVV